MRGLISVSWRGSRAAMRARAVTAALALTVAGLALHVAADAVGTIAGPATVKTAGAGADLAAGDSGTVFTLRLPSGAACPGDSANGGYRWQTYMVPASVDPATLTFGSTGPLPPGTNAVFRQPLYDSLGGGSVVNMQTANADNPSGPGRILNIPDMDYAVFGPGVIAVGSYNVGVACTLGPAGPDQMKNFWNVRKTFTAGGGPSEVNWTLESPSTTTTVAPTTVAPTTVAPTSSTSVPATSSTLGTTTTVAPTTSSTLGTTTTQPSTTTTAVESTTTTQPLTTTTGAPTTTTIQRATPTTAAPATATIGVRPFALLCSVLRQVFAPFLFLRGLFEALAAVFGC